MNNVSIIGYVTRDAEMRYIPSGEPVTSFTVAVNGFKKDDVNFFNCKAWGRKAEVCAEYCKKGKQIGLNGRIEIGSYEKEFDIVKNGEAVLEKTKFTTIEIIVNDITFIGKKE